MPSLNFVLPHWLYWSVLALFPLCAMVGVRRQRRARPAPRPWLSLAYLFWLSTGFLGLHRFYLRSAVGFVFVPVFLFILYGNAQLRDAREDISRTRAQVEASGPRVARLEARLARAGGGELAAELEKAKREAASARAEHALAEAGQLRWERITNGSALLMLAMLVVDALLLPGLVRRRVAVEAAEAAGAAAFAEPPTTPAPPVAGAGTAQDPTAGMRGGFVGWIDTMNRYVGDYVSYWALIAVFAYYYEVVARYVFNSPTNWVHESMFLMFGIQYMLSGAYAYRDDSHVRVDIFYARLSARGRALCDVLTSAFFFVFTITMLVTGWRFASDAIRFNEVSFTEWAIQYWPVKLAIPIGAALIVLQGLVRLIRDVALLRNRQEA